MDLAAPDLDGSKSLVDLQVAVTQDAVDAKGIVLAATVLTTEQVLAERGSGGINVAGLRKFNTAQGVTVLMQDLRIGRVHRWIRIKERSSQYRAIRR